jgi:REP element-mobilizing transposase RayT
MIGDDTYAYRRHLPHLVNQGKNYFITFRTQRWYVIPPAGRTEIVATAVDLHLKWCWVHVITVMPDHAHTILTPYGDDFAEVMQRLKGGSSFRANRILNRRGQLWQDESFDHILRSDESLTQKMDYICDNPVRAGLVQRWQDYPWTWRACDRR